MSRRLPSVDVPSRGLVLDRLHRALELAGVAVHGLEERAGVVRVILQAGASESDLARAGSLAASLPEAPPDIDQVKAELVDIQMEKLALAAAAALAPAGSFADELDALATREAAALAKFI